MTDDDKILGIDQISKDLSYSSSLYNTIKHFVEMELLRYQIFAATGVSLLSIWLALLNHSATASNPLVLYAPVWSVLLLGLYAIISVILGTMSFKDCPEAAAEIETQIKEAKTEMKKRGIIKD